MADEERFPFGYLDEVIPWRYKFQRLWRFLTLYYRRHPAVINPPPPPSSRDGGDAGVREPRRPRPTPSASSVALVPPRDE